MRIKSILQKVPDLAYNDLKIAPASHSTEENVQLICTKLPKAIAMAYSRCEPHHLCDFAFDLAASFNRFLCSL